MRGEEFNRRCWFLLLTVLALSGSTAIGGVLTDRDRLYQDIFANYSPKTLPVIDHTHTVNISFEVQIININNFDEISGELSITSSFRLFWKEERIQWEPTDYNQIGFIFVQQADLWRPQLYLLECSDNVVDLSRGFYQPILSYTGDVTLAISNVLRVICSVNVAYFPFDEQTCVMSLFNWNDKEEVEFYLGKSDIGKKFLRSNSQWTMVSGNLVSCSDLYQPCVRIELTLKRRSGFYIIYLFVPIIFLSVINNFVFLLPPSSGERTSVAITTFLSFIVYMGIVNDVVPQSSDPVAEIYYYLTALIVYSCTILFLCIISLKIYDEDTEIPRRLKTILWYLRLQFLLSKRRLEVAERKDVLGKTSTDFVKVMGLPQKVKNRRTTKLAYTTSKTLHPTDQTSQSLVKNVLGLLLDKRLIFIVLFFYTYF